MRAGESRPVAVSSVGSGGTVGVSMPGEGWGASFMAGLPHLLICIFIVGSALIGTVKGINQNAFGYLQIIVFLLLLFGVLFYSVYKGWRRWSTSWLVYMFIFAISLLSIAENALRPLIKGRNDWLDGILIILVPL
jgi:predicted membrane channel-forming protein YqfA (hemolysin III family)